MNTEKLKMAQAAFLMTYPQGFDTPELAERTKHHDMTRRVAFAREAFSPGALEDTETAAENFIKLVARSSMVSMFEKPRLREAVHSMTYGEREDLMGLIRELLHGNEAMGFNGLAGMLAMRQAAKWPVVTALRCYYYPDTDLIIKPTTVKNVIAQFELPDLTYTPHPNFAFYERYRATLQDMRAQTAAPMNGYALAGYSGFLMMAMGEWL
jgi:hypothetical protein